jgi:hypothetical protein
MSECKESKVFDASLQESKVFDSSLQESKVFDSSLQESKVFQHVHIYHMLAILNFFVSYGLLKVLSPLFIYVG